MEKCWFYLSYENSNCTDYITEKYSNALESYTIPIVNGWKESYDKRLPGKFWIYSVSAPRFFYDPQLQILCCYIALYYVKKIARAPGVIKNLCSLS